MSDHVLERMVMGVSMHDVCGGGHTCGCVNAYVPVMARHLCKPTWAHISCLGHAREYRPL